MAERLKLDNVVFIDSVPKADVPRYWSLLDVSVIHLRKTELFTTVIPSKLFECMGMGIPVLHGVEGESADIVRRECVGIPFEPEGVDELCAALRSLKSDPVKLENFRRECLRAANNYDRSFLALRMLRVLEDTAVGVKTGPMKVLLLNQVFWPDVAATAQHGHDLGRHLVERGACVTALSSRSLYGAAGGSLPREGHVDGIRIVRAGRSVFGKRGLASRAFDFLSFYLASMLKAISLPRQDVVVCFTTPPFIAFVGILLGWLKGTKVVCWTMDLYPDVPVAAGVLRRGSLAHSIFEALDRFCLKRADRIVVLGRCMEERVRARGIDPSKIEVINVWADDREVTVQPSEKSVLRTEWGLGNAFVVEYSGNFGIGHDGAAMYGAMEAMRKDEGLRWVVVGGGTKRAEVETFVREHAICNAVLRPYQRRERLGELLALGDVHLVTIAEGFDGLLVPSKFYGVLAAGRPVVYVGPRDTEVARVIASASCGVLIAQGDSAALVQAIQSLRADPTLVEAMGRRARVAFERDYTRDRACDRWHELLRRIDHRSSEASVPAP
jgi:glycosyltransferase involved in cell wall biosynthesis